MEKAIITGILRAPTENFFCSVNNAVFYSFLKDEYSEHFGFTEIEVDDLLKKAGLYDKHAEIKQKGELNPNWADIYDTRLIKDLLKLSPTKFKQDIEALIKGEGVEHFIDEKEVFQYVKIVWS